MFIPFTRFRHTSYIPSIIAVVLSILSIIIFGFKYGLDFTGGTKIGITYTTDTTIEAINEALESTGIITQTPKIQSADAKNYTITMQDLDDNGKTVVSTGLQKIGEYKENSYQKVDSAVGETFKNKAFIAISLSLFFIVCYIAFSFRSIPDGYSSFKFGLVAIIALFHDVIIVCGVFSLLGYFIGIEADLLFLTALLSTLGFSVSDTIVILDRLRENLILHTNRSFQDNIDISLNETLRRSIATSLSTIIPIIAILIWGADSIWYFMFAIALGVLVGSYSSIFIAAPLLLDLYKESKEGK